MIKKECVDIYSSVEDLDEVPVMIKVFASRLIAELGTDPCVGMRCEECEVASPSVEINDLSTTRSIVIRQTRQALSDYLGAVTGQPNVLVDKQDEFELSA